MLPCVLVRISNLRNIAILNDSNQSVRDVLLHTLSRQSVAQNKNITQVGHKEVHYLDLLVLNNQLEVGKDWGTSFAKQSAIESNMLVIQSLCESECYSVI